MLVPMSQWWCTSIPDSTCNQPQWEDLQHRHQHRYKLGLFVFRGVFFREAYQHTIRVSAEQSRVFRKASEGKNPLSCFHWQPYFPLSHLEGEALLWFLLIMLEKHRFGKDHPQQAFEAASWIKDICSRFSLWSLKDRASWSDKVPQGKATNYRHGHWLWSLRQEIVG